MDPRGSHRTTNTDDPDISDPLLRSSLDIVRDGHYLGTLFIGFDLMDERAHIEQRLLAFRLGSLVFFIRGVLIAFIASGMLIRPLTSLIETMSRIAAGDHSVRAGTPSGDEFRALASSFNGLVENWNEATTKLASSEERFRTLVENLSEGVTMDSADETVVYSNRAADEFFGVKVGTLVGRRYTDFLDPEQLSALKREQMIRREGKQSTYDIGIRRPEL